MGRTERILKNGSILALVAVFMRTVSVFFGAYVNGRLGESAMGLLTLVLSVYGFAVTFAQSGVSLAVTRMVAEKCGRGDGRGARRTMGAALLYALLFGGGAAAILFFGARFFATALLQDVRAASSLRLLSLSLLPISLSSALGGYFVGVRRPYHNAAKELFEQGVRIGLTVVLLGAFLPEGLEYACLAVVGGTSLSEGASFFLRLFQYLIDRRRHPLPLEGAGGGQFSALCGIALPTAVAAWCRSGLVTVQHLLIPTCLALWGGSREVALASYAALHGMALSVVLWPTGVLGAFAGLLIPEFSEMEAMGRWGEIRHGARKALYATLAFSCLSAAALFASAEGLGDTLYQSKEVGAYIRLLAPLVPIMYMDSATDAILKGLGKQVYCMGVNIADAAASVGLVLLLLPRFGVGGYVAMIWITEILNFLFSFGKLLFLLRPSLRSLSAAALPLFASAAAAMIGFPLSGGGWLAPMLAVLGVFSLVFLLLSRKNVNKA